MEKTKVQELEILNDYYNTGKNQILIVYGHIKTGSENVLKSFAKDKESVLYCAVSASERLQQYIWGKDRRNKGASLPEYPTYTEIFEVYERIAINNNKPLVIFIEQFEDIMKSSPDFLEEVSKVIYRDTHPQMMLVLMGNNAAWIENNMVDKLGSQASNITGFLKIKPYSFQEMRKRFANMSDQDVVCSYAVFGGKANLWAYFDENKTFKQNVCEKFLDVINSVLLRMTNATLEENLRETAVYNTILYGLANGQNKLNDIHHATGFSRAKIMVYLKSLIELGMVEKVYSFATTGHENVQKGVYRIIDPLADFYFRFLYQNTSQMVRMKPDEFYDMYISEGLSDFVNNSFKLVCKEYVMKLSEYNRLPFEIEEEGEWVGKMGTLDIVAQSETGDTLVGICEWSKKMDLDSLEFVRTCSKRARISPDYYYLFSAVGFDDALVSIAQDSSSIKLISLDDLMKG
jgi:AAA+ ATPase superfamily predicted ATPase